MVKKFHSYDLYVVFYGRYKDFRAVFTPSSFDKLKILASDMGKEAHYFYSPTGGKFVFDEVRIFTKRDIPLCTSMERPIGHHEYEVMVRGLLTGRLESPVSYQTLEIDAMEGDQHE